MGNLRNAVARPPDPCPRTADPSWPCLGPQSSCQGAETGPRAGWPAGPLLQGQQLPRATGARPAVWAGSAGCGLGRPACRSLKPQAAGRHQPCCSWESCGRAREGAGARPPFGLVGDHSPQARVATCGSQGAAGAAGIFPEGVLAPGLWHQAGEQGPVTSHTWVHVCPGLALSTVS